MILVELSISNQEIKEILITGHAPEILGNKGANLLCAAASILAGTLCLTLEKRGLLREKEVQSGNSRLVLRNVSDNNAQKTELLTIIDMFLTGMENLKKDHPGELQINYTEV